jgi:hypothetical protein
LHGFDTACGQQGDVIDLWAALHHRDLRAAALDLVQTFNLEPAPTSGTEKRQGEARLGSSASSSPERETRPRCALSVGPQPRNRPVIT